MKLKTQRILILLAEKRMTKAMLAANSGISRQNLCTILGRGTCAPITAGKLAAGLAVPVIEIVEE